MIAGRSSCNGILIYDLDKKKDHCVYGYYDQDEIVLLQGSYADMNRLQYEHESPFESTGKTLFILLIAFLFLAVIVRSAYCSGSPLVFWTALLYALFAYFFVAVLFMAFGNSYKSRRQKRQMRRFHGCEHAMVDYYHKAFPSTVWSAEELRRHSIFHTCCGTSCAGYTLCFLTVLAYLICRIPELGFLCFLGGMILCPVILFILFLLPFNPFVLLQIPMVSKPTERELKLGIAILEQFCLCENIPE